MKIKLLFLSLVFNFSVSGQQYSETFTSGIPSNWSISDANRIVILSNSVSNNSIPVGGSASGGNNLTFRDCTPSGNSVSVIVSDINMSTRTDIKIGLARRRSGSFNPTVALDYSIDGSTWSNLSNNINPGTGTSWAFINFNLGSDANNQSNIRFRFTYTTSSTSACNDSSPNFRIDDFIVFYGSNSFPINLISFKGQNNNGQNLLNWSTDSESNFSHFEVMRSFDAKGYESIARIDGKGTETNKTSYSFIDEKPAYGNNYYKLKQVDKDGSFEFSKAISIYNTDTPDILIYPNPSYDKVFIKNVSAIEISNIEIKNLSGKTLKSLNNSQGEINIHDLLDSKLIFEVRLKNGTSFTKTIIKL